MARSRRTRPLTGRRAGRTTLVVGAWAVLCAGSALVAAGPALGADRIYWPNVGNNTISFANLDGSGGGQLTISGTTPDLPVGVAIDSAAGRIYWTNNGNALTGDNGSIASANLDGSGGAIFTGTGAASVMNPAGLAIDPVARRLYWTNSGNDTVSFASLDGAGGADLNTTGIATVAAPGGITLKPGARVYWANTAVGFSAISLLELDGSGGGDFNAGKAATVNLPQAVALDPDAGKLYWTNIGSSPSTITVADLTDASGNGDHDLDFGATSLNLPIGIALDPDAGKLYWSDGSNGGSIVSASLNGQGAAPLPTPGATFSGPGYLALLRSPIAAGPPAITGAAQPGSLLSCSQGTWAGDLSAAFLYRAPRLFAFQWSLNGADVAGATSSALTAGSPGDYRCRVTASNDAGGATQTSAPFTVGSATGVPPAAFGSSTRVTLALASARISSRGPVRVRIVNGNAFAVAGTLSAQTAKPVAAAHRRRVKLGSKRVTVPANASRTLALALPASLRRLLARQHSLPLALSIAVADPAGHRRTVSKTLTPRLLVARRSRQR